jgi:hypothetical protein
MQPFRCTDCPACAYNKQDKAINITLLIINLALQFHRECKVLRFAQSQQSDLCNI